MKYLVLIIFIATSALADVNFRKQTIAKSLTQAKKEKKLIFAVFSGESCPACKRMDKGVYTDPELSKLVNKKLIPVKHEFESSDSDGRAEKYTYDAWSLPSIMILDEEGKIVKRVPYGNNSLEYIKKFVNGVLNEQNSQVCLETYEFPKPMPAVSKGRFIKGLGSKLPQCCDDSAERTHKNTLTGYDVYCILPTRFKKAVNSKVDELRGDESEDSDQDSDATATSK